MYKYSRQVQQTLWSDLADSMVRFGRFGGLQVQADSGADPASEKGGVEIEKVRMGFATLESGELHNIVFFVIL